MDSRSLKPLLFTITGLIAAVPCELYSAPTNDLATIPSASNPKVSGNGQFVAFESAAALVPGDTNGAIDIYRLEIATGIILLVSDGVNGIGTALSGPADARNPSISSDGNVIAYDSLADNLVPLDTNGFFIDQNGTVVFVPDLGQDVFVADILQNTINRISERATGGGLAEEADWASNAPSVSADGRFIAFSTGSTNLVPGFNSDGFGICVYDTTTQGLTGIPIPDRLDPTDYYECVAPTISGDGNFVAFQFDVFAANYQYSGVYRYSLVDGSSVGLVVPTNGVLFQRPSLSITGGFMGFDTNLDLDPNDNNGENDYYVYLNAPQASTEFFWVSDGSSDRGTTSGNASSDIWNDRNSVITKQDNQGNVTLFGEGLRSSLSFDGGIVALETFGGEVRVVQDLAVINLPPVPPAPPAGALVAATPVAPPATAPASAVLPKGSSTPATIPGSRQTPASKPSTKAGAPAAVAPAVAAVVSISDVINQSVVSGFSTAAIPVKIGPVNSALVLKATSSNQILVPDSGIVLGGSGANRTITIKAAPNKSGPVTITLTVSDGKLSATDTFVLTVTPGKPQNFAVRFTAKGPAQVDGNVIRNIGKAKIKDKKGVTKTITITNTGTTPLRGLKIVRGGLAASDFIVLKLDKKPLAPKKSTSFEVVFKAKATGTRQAELQIFSSETPDNPFDLTVTGTGSR